LIDIRQLSTVGGEISYTTFGPADSENVIFAPHGITANMMTWVGLAESLPDARIVAPDLRGRGRSNSLEGPFGLEQHALDAIELLDSLDIESYHIIGHSMGGFVSVRLAALDPSRVRSVLLVDGGLPLPRPNAVSDQDLVRATLGPAAERLEMVFGSESEYLDFWRAHPAFAETWSELLEQYLRHDLADVAGALKPSASISAVSADILELFGSADYLDAMRAIEAPVSFIRAPRGLLNAEPLYGKELGNYSAGLFESFKPFEARDVNHYTILLSRFGAKQVAEVFENQLLSNRKVTR
jgi:lipase